MNETLVLDPHNDMAVLHLDAAVWARWANIVVKAALFGSNIFNSLAVAGVAAVVGTGRLHDSPSLSVQIMVVVTLLALVPLLMVGSAIAGAFGFRQDLEDALRARAAELPADYAAAVEQRVVLDDADAEA
ncbi:MAG: hypothetical protein ACO3VI_11535, partial [Ilumatobacteraceae bacterium]